MCGRYTLTASPEAVQQAFQLAEMPQLAPRYNIAPTQAVPVITRDAPASLTMLRWGLIPSWAKDPSIASTLINARGETLDEKPAFRDSFRKRRCLIPADGFYEWAKDGGDKRPHYIHQHGRPVFAFAGLWDAWKDPNTGQWVKTCTIITTEPNDLIRPLHHRMAVMLDPEAYDLWLSGEEAPEALKPLLQTYPAEKLTYYEVSPAVNSAASESPDLILPYQAPRNPQQMSLF